MQNDITIINETYTPRYQDKVKVNLDNYKIHIRYILRDIMNNNKKREKGAIIEYIISKLKLRKISVLIS